MHRLKTVTCSLLSCNFDRLTNTAISNWKTISNLIILWCSSFLFILIFTNKTRQMQNTATWSQWIENKIWKLKVWKHFSISGYTISKSRIKKSDDSRLGDCDVMQNDAITLNIILSIFSSIFSRAFVHRFYHLIYASISNQFPRVEENKNNKSAINGHIAKILWIVVDPLKCKDQNKIKTKKNEKRKLKQWNGKTLTYWASSHQSAFATQTFGRVVGWSVES